VHDVPPGTRDFLHDVVKETISMLDITIPPVVIFSISFLLVAMAAKTIGAFFSRYGLPYIDRKSVV
jgi:hypothetical protein